MNIFKRIFGKKDKEKENECWYNNHHEKKRKRWSEPVDGAGLTENQFDQAVVNQIAKRQH